MSTPAVSGIGFEPQASAKTGVSGIAFEPQRSPQVGVAFFAWEGTGAIRLESQKTNIFTGGVKSNTLTGGDKRSHPGYFA